MCPEGVHKSKTAEKQMQNIILRLAGLQRLAELQHKLDSQPHRVSAVPVKVLIGKDEILKLECGCVGH